MPLVPSLPDGPPVALVAAHVTLGGNLSYYEKRQGRTVAYRPRGIGLPRYCPKGGFRFSATFSFIDGTNAAARTSAAHDASDEPRRPVPVRQRIPFADGSQARHEA